MAKRVLRSGHLLLKAKKYNLHSNIHEGACVVSGEYTCTRTAPISAVDIEADVSRAVASLRDVTLKEGGIVGHIKAFIGSESASVMISSTGKALTTRPMGKWPQAMLTCYTISIAAIVFKLPLQFLENHLLSELDILSQNI